MYLFQLLYSLSQIYVYILHFLFHESWFSNGCEVVEPISFKTEVEEGLSVKPHLYNCSTQALSAEICFASACTIF